MTRSADSGRPLRADGTNVVLVETGAKSARLDPREELREVVLKHWWARWHVPHSESQEVRVLSDASIHLVLEEGRSRLVGVVTGVFTRQLQGRGEVVGAKLLPGALRRFVREPASAWTDREVPLSELFGGEASQLERRVLAQPEVSERVRIYEEFMLPRLLPVDSEHQLALAAVELLDRDPDLHRVDALALALGCPRRRLSQVFGEVIGASPKWFIRRHRLLAAARRMEAGEPLPMAALAADLGYFDQAHFNRDFAATVGESPGAFARRVRPQAAQGTLS